MKVESALKNGAAASLLKERAYDELKRRILNDDYPPGSFLAERRLAEQLGMSKTPVKAALERLELEGFICVSPQQGIVVREFSVHEIADLYEIRAALESYTMRLIAGRLSETQIARLRANLAALKKIGSHAEHGNQGGGAERGNQEGRQAERWNQAPAAEPGNQEGRQAEPGNEGGRDVSGAVVLDAEFHILFTRFLGNREFLRVMEHLRHKMHRVITKAFHLNPGRIDTSYEEHKAIVESVVAGNGSRAAKLIESHLEKGKQLILERGQK
jgi:DNA-binding GntR family transcriptional regulator